MKHGTAGVGLALLVAISSVVPSGAKDSWLHIRVEEHDRDGETVRINLPLKLVESLLPLIDTRDEGGEFHLSNGRIYFDCKHLEDMDFRAALEAVKEADDAEYVTVKGRHEDVRVAKEKGDLLINVDDRDEKVRVRLRMNIVEALLQADEDELDLVAMIRALQEHGEGELVTVESEDESVRIWIDTKSSD